MTTVFIASSNVNLKDYVKAILDTKRDFHTIACSCHYDDIIVKVEIQKPHFFIIDLIEDYRSGLILIEKMKKLVPSLQMIAINKSTDHNVLVDAFRKGVEGYLVKDGLFNELNKCICTLLQGEKYVSNEIANIVLDFYNRLPNEELENSFFLLSQKEKEHITHIGNGLNPKEIAHIMQISKKTVDNYRNRIMVKLHLNSIADIVKYAIREQFVEL